MAARGVSSVIIADRSPVFLYGLSAILHAEREFEVVAKCQDGETCIKMIQALCPDLALLDLSLPPYDGFQVLTAVKGGQLTTRVVYLSASADTAMAARAIAKGGYGVIPKDVTAQTLVEDLRQVMRGLRLSSPFGAERVDGYDPRAAHEDNIEAVLTERELEIMRLVCAGLSNKEVGRQLKLSDGTIKVHLHHIYRKLAIHNRTALAALASNTKQPSERSAIRREAGPTRSG